MADEPKTLTELVEKWRRYSEPKLRPEYTQCADELEVLVKKIDENYTHVGDRRHYFTIRRDILGTVKE